MGNNNLTKQQLEKLPFWQLQKMAGLSNRMAQFALDVRGSTIRKWRVSDAPKSVRDNLISFILKQPVEISNE